MKKWLAIGCTGLIGLCIIVTVIGALVGDDKQAKPDTMVSVEPSPEPITTSAPVVSTEVPKSIPVSTATARPTNTPRATPTSAAEARYVQKIQGQAQTMGESFTRFSDLMRYPKLTDAKWAISVAAEMVTWKSIYKEAQSLQPPERFAAVHTKYLSALGQFDSATADITTGIDRLDSNRLNAGTVKIREGTNLLTEITGMILQLVGN